MISNMHLMSWCHVTVRQPILDLYSEHSCGSRSNVWRVLASLVTEGLQLRAFDIITRSSGAVGFASLVLVAYVMCELYTF